MIMHGLAFLESDTNIFLLHSSVLHARDVALELGVVMDCFLLFFLRVI